MAAVEDDFDNLEREICQLFNIKELNTLQKDAIRAVTDSNNVLVSTKTGSGKSLMYWSALLARSPEKRKGQTQPQAPSDDEMDFEDDLCRSILLPGDYSGIVVVVVPLLAIMKEHTEKLEGLGFSATFIGRDVREELKIKTGQFQFVYARPEDIVGEEKWRIMVSSDVYRERICCFVVDEAHAVVNWGESKAGEDPFRIWFSRIGELRSLCPGTLMIALTATASPPKRNSIMKSLCMKASSTKLVLDSPDRPNIKLNFKCVKASKELQDVFGWLLLNASSRLPKHIVFCRRISDCAKLFKTFKDNGKLEHIEMYHSKTLAHVQDAIRDDLCKENGRIRILFCTNAAGMGVNFVSVYNVVNYGPPGDLDTLLQQIGRAGRDGLQSQHLLLYNKRQLRKCDPHVLEFVKNESSCRRKNLMQAYGTDGEPIEDKHLCCDICCSECICGSEGCDDIHDIVVWLNTHDILEEAVERTCHRHSTDAQKDDLRGFLVNYKDKQLIRSGSGIIPDNLIHGFTDGLIDDIVENCDYLNSVDDLIAMTDVMSLEQACDVLEIMTLVFLGSMEEFADSDDGDDYDDL